MHKFTIFSIIILLFGIGALGMKSPGNKNIVYPNMGYTIVSTKTVTRPNSVPVLTGIITRLVTSDGYWKCLEVTFLGNGNVILQETSGAPNGVLKTMRNRGENQFLSSWTQPTSELRETKTFTRHPGFVKEEEVLGHRGFLIHEEALNGIWSDRVFVPELGNGIGIKITTFRPDEGLEVIEPIFIKLGEPNLQEVIPPNLPIKFDWINEKIKNLEQSGQKNIADGYRQQIKDR